MSRVVSGTEAVGGGPRPCEADRAVHGHDTTGCPIWTEADGSETGFLSSRDPDPGHRDRGQHRGLLCAQGRGSQRPPLTGTRAPRGGVGDAGGVLLVPAILRRRLSRCTPGEPHASGIRSAGRRLVQSRRRRLPLRLPGAACTASLLRLLGVPPLHGRLFIEEEEIEGNNLVIILSHGL